MAKKVQIKINRATCAAFVSELLEWQCEVARSDPFSATCDSKGLNDRCGADSLRRVCYERCTVNPTAATFLLSALWHGVYPGYYLTFLTGIAVTMAARSVSARTASTLTASSDSLIAIFFSKSLKN